MQKDKTRLILFIFLFFLTAFRLYYIQAIPISEDEANYWQWARHLSFGYYDQGPLIAWIIRLSIEFFGNTAFGIRFPAVMMGLGISLLIFDFCKRIFRNEQLGLWLVIAVNGTLFFTVAGIIQTYDTPLAFFWALAVHQSAMAVFKNRKWSWYVAGLASGLAMLAKYTAGLFPFFLFVFLLTSPEHRRWLNRKEPWLAAILAALVLSPNLVWNAMNHWTAFVHTAGKTSGFNFTADEYLGGQAALIGPIFFIMLVIGLVMAFRQAQKGDAIMAFLLWTSIPAWLLFFIVSFKTRVYVNWPAPVYISAILAAGPPLYGKIRTSIRWTRWWKAGLATGYLIVAAAIFHGPVIGLLGLPSDVDPTTKLYGWKTVGTAISQELENWPGKEKPFIFGIKYQTASLAAFYTPGQPETECIFLPGERLNCYLPWTNPAALKGRDGLGISFGTPDFTNYFSRCEILRKVDLIGASGNVMGQVNLFHCYDFKGKDARPQKYLDMLGASTAADNQPG